MIIVRSRMLKSLYRREPVVSFVVTVGAVDAALGGLTEHWSLLAIGLSLVAGAIGLRWWMSYRQRPLAVRDRAPVHILPPAQPTLRLPRKNSSQQP